MKIEIKSLLEGAKKAKGITVIIDVFRAFSLEVIAAANHAYRIIPVDDIDKAFELAKTYSNSILIGERNGVKIDGFDYGNSPSEIFNIDFNNKVIIHTTSAGTQGIVNAINASEILTGSFLNAKAIASYIKAQNPNVVTLVPMGLNGKEKTNEDELCARYIKALLEEKELNINKELENLKYTSGAKFFDPKQNTVFPTKDFYICTELNKYNFVLKIKKEGEHLISTKINVKIG